MKKAEELKLYAPEPKRPELDAALCTSLQYARKNPEAVRVWMPLPKLPWEEKK